VAQKTHEREISIASPSFAAQKSSSLSVNLSETEVWHAVHLGVRPFVVMNRRVVAGCVSDDEFSRLESEPIGRCVLVPNNPSTVGVSSQANSHARGSAPLLDRHVLDALETAMQNAFERSDTAALKCRRSVRIAARRRVTNQRFWAECSYDVFHYHLCYFSSIPRTWNVLGAEARPKGEQ
jgi:hypothetical protein